MRIGEAAGQAGTTAKAIRYYESIGLIREAERTAAGYRDYGPDDVERLIFIRSTQRLGFSLDEIREVLAFRERDAQPCRIRARCGPTSHRRDRPAGPRTPRASHRADRPCCTCQRR